MADFYSGTLVASALTNGSPNSVFGTHHSVLGVGGYMEVKKLVDRNKIPVDVVNGIYYDNMSSGQRRIGMLVYVHETDIIYQLRSSVPYNIWDSTSHSSSLKMAILADNNNWVNLLNTSGFTVNGSKISKKFTQTTHGFVVGDVIGYDRTGGLFIKSSSSNGINVEPIGMIDEINGDEFNLVFSGEINTTGITDSTNANLVSGTKYYISAIAGKITSIEPTLPSELIKPILTTVGGNSGIVLQYAGRVSDGGGVSLSVFNSYVNDTAIELSNKVSGATNIGLFVGNVGKQTLVINSTTTAHNGDYVSVYNNYYRDNTGVIRIGAPLSGILRRGYVRSTLPVRSWVWNEYTGNSNQVGWILVDGNIETSVGLNLTGLINAIPYSNTTWTEGSTYDNGGNINIVVQGNTGGAPYVNAGPVFANITNSVLNLRTIISDNSDVISVRYDGAFIRLSGSTANSLSSLIVNNGLTKTGDNIKLGGDIIEDTIITDSRGFGLEYSGSYKNTFKAHSLVDREYVDSRGSINTNILTNSLSYIVTPSDYYVGAPSNPSGGTVYLPPLPVNGRVVVVYDKDGHAGTGDEANNIKVNGNENTILGYHNAVINTDSGSITFLFNGVEWSVIAFTSAPSYVQN